MNLHNNKDEEVAYLYEKQIEDDKLEILDKIIPPKRNLDLTIYELAVIEKAHKEKEEYEKMYNEMYAHLIDDKKQTLEEKELETFKTIESMRNNKKSIPKHLKAVENINDIVTAYSKSVDFSDYEINKEHMTVEEYNTIVSAASKSSKENMNSNNDKVIKAMPLPFEKKKFMQANFFMKIGHFIGLSLRNQYYKNLDDEVIKALNNDQVYRVLEAQQNGYFLGKKLNLATLDKLYDQLTTTPSKLINELVVRDILLSDEKLSLVILSPEGKDLILNQHPEDQPYAKKLYEDLVKKENFLFANKNAWLRSIKDEEVFLKEDNALFYHDKMLSICEKSELEGVKSILKNILQNQEVLNSISKTRLIDKMLLKLDLQLGNSIQLEHMVSDLPQVAQKIYHSIKNITFSTEDKKVLESAYQFEYELVEKRMPEAIMKYLSVDIQYRDNLKNVSGNTAESLLIETLENILITKKDLNLFINQQKLSDLSVTRRYTDSIRGDIGKPSIVTLKTVQQLRESGELSDFSNEQMFENINRKNSNADIHEDLNNNAIAEPVRKKKVIASNATNDIMHSNSTVKKNKI